MTVLIIACCVKRYDSNRFHIEACDYNKPCRNVILSSGPGPDTPIYAIQAEFEVFVLYCIYGSIQI